MTLPSVNAIAALAPMGAAVRVIYGAPFTVFTIVKPPGFCTSSVAPVLSRPAGALHGPEMDVHISNLIDPMLAAVAVVTATVYVLVAPPALEPSVTLRGVS